MGLSVRLGGDPSLYKRTHYRGRQEEREMYLNPNGKEVKNRAE